MPTPQIDQVISGQQLGLAINSNAEAARPAFLFGRRASTTVALTRGYYGGVALIGSTLTTIPHGTVSLTASATNYMEVDPATFVPSVNATGWTGGFIPIAKIVTDGTGILSDDSVLVFAFQGASAGSYSLPIASDVLLGGIKVGSGLSIAIDGVLHALPGAYVLPNASSSVLGGIKVGSGLSIDPATGILSNSGTGVSLSATNVWAKNQSVASVGLTDGATIAVDASLSNNFTVTLGGNRTLANPTSLTDGMVLNFRIKQDATGSRTLAYGAKYKFPGGTAPVLSTAANAVDLMSCYYDATDDQLECNLIKAFA